MKSVKICLVGDTSVGKTCLCFTYAGVFPVDYVPTIFDGYAANDTVDGISIYYSLWDTPGSQEYEKLRPLSYPNTDIFLICFSVVSPSSFNNVSSKWLPEIRHHCPSVPCILVGTNSDLREDPLTMSEMKSMGTQPINRHQCIQLAKDIGALMYMECSSLRDKGVQEIFQHAKRSVVSPGINKKKEKICVTL